MPDIDAENGPSVAFGAKGESAAQTKVKGRVRPCTVPDAAPGNL
jgi:hypothetical protein